MRTEPGTRKLLPRVLVSRLLNCCSSLSRAPSSSANSAFTVSLISRSKARKSLQASVTWPSWFGFQVAPDFAHQYSAELARVQRFEGIKLGGPFAEAFLETRSALFGLLDGGARQAIFDALVVRQHDRSHLDLNIGPAAVDFMFDFSCHRDGHAHSSRIKIRDIEDPRSAAFARSTSSRQRRAEVSPLAGMMFKPY